MEMTPAVCGTNLAHPRRKVVGVVLGIVATAAGLAHGVASALKNVSEFEPPKP